MTEKNSVCVIYPRRERPAKNMKKPKDFYYKCPQSIEVFWACAQIINILIAPPDT